MWASVENNGRMDQCFKNFGLFLLNGGLISWLVVAHLLGSEISQGLVGAFALILVGINAKYSARRVFTRQNKPLPS